MTPLKGIAHWLFGEYELYKVYTIDLEAREPVPSTRSKLGRIEDLAEIAKSPDSEIRALGEYGGAEAYGFGAWVDGALACVCWFWAGERYRQRNFWPLQVGETKLVQITTAARFQGRGVASELIRFAAHRMKLEGFRRAYARIWHSNSPSVRLFEGAGWKYIAFVALLYPRRARRPIRLAWRKSSR